MQARLTTKPEQDVVAAIQSLDLDAVKVRIMDAELGEGWTREYADSIEVAYRNYLTMLVKYPDDAEDIMLSEDVDEFWHTHILHTMKYADDCQKVFGNFLHHNPQTSQHSSADVEKRAWLAEKTRRLYQQEAEKAAYCNASVRAEKAAYCNASIRAHNAAYCNATLKAEKVAYCNASVRAEKAAYCNASIRAHNAAYCNAALKAEELAYCNASVRAEKAAYCNASVRAHGDTVAV